MPQSDPNIWDFELLFFLDYFNSLRFVFESKKDTQGHGNSSKCQFLKLSYAYVFSSLLAVIQ